MEYVVGPVLALLISLKFTDYKLKKAGEAIKEQHSELIADVEKRVVSNSKEIETKIVDNNKIISQQTLKMMVPMVTSVQKINNQLGL